MAPVNKIPLGALLPNSVNIFAYYNGIYIIDSIYDLIDSIPPTSFKVGNYIKVSSSKTYDELFFAILLF